jgi:hypothetical protein
LPNLVDVNLELSNGAWWGVAAVAFGLAAIRTTWNFHAKLALLRIPLDLTVDVAKDERIRFGVLHISDGYEGGDEVGPLLNVTKDFRRDREDATRLSARLRYERRLGCQFKCFANFRDLSFEEVRSLLEQQVEIREVTRGGVPNRALFLHKCYAVVQTKDGYTNNFVYPE